MKNTIIFILNEEINNMQIWIIETMEKFGYLGIALLIALENIFPPIPSEVILTFGGFMTTYSDLYVWGVIVAATIGSLIGAFVLYSLGRLLPADRIAKILDGRIGQILHLQKDDVYKSCDWFNERGKVTVLFCRCIPVIRSLISLPAGMANMKFGLFMLYTTIGSFVWNIILVYLGVFASNSWERIVDGTGIFTKITIIVIGTFILIAGIWFVKTRFLGKKTNKLAS